MLHAMYNQTRQSDDRTHSVPRWFSESNSSSHNSGRYFKTNRRCAMKSSKVSRRSKIAILLYCIQYYQTTVFSKDVQLGAVNLFSNIHVWTQNTVVSYKNEIFNKIEATCLCMGSKKTGFKFVALILTKISHFHGMGQFILVYWYLSSKSRSIMAMVDFLTLILF